MSTKYCICVDGGTTNTRATVWSAPKNKLAGAKRPVGVRNTSIDGHNGALKIAVAECLAEAMETAGCGWDDIGCIMAAGMITSNLGIHEVPHLTAPVGLADFAAGVQTVDLPDIAPLPFHFIPGVRNLDVPVSQALLPQMDIMRGEEVEALALLNGLPKGTGCVLVLPGSHTKFVFVDEDHCITACMTTLSGEILSLLTKESILADTVGGRFAEEDTCDMDWVHKGFVMAQEYGLARTAFACRIGGLFSDASQDQMASFLMGAVLQQDVLALTSRLAAQGPAHPHIFVAGKPPFRQVLHGLLSASPAFAGVEELVERAELSAQGCMAVAAQKGLWSEDV